MANEVIIAERWAGVLKSLADGTPLEDALQQHKLLYSEMKVIVLSSPEEAQRWRDAKLQGKASRFSILQQDEIFSRVARGVLPETAVAEVCGPETAEQDTADLFELIGGLPEWEERFLDAMRVAGLRGIQKLDAIVADDRKDILHCEKRGLVPNPVGVQRARLNWEHETWKLGKFNPNLFGERAQNQVNLQVNINHAERLEECRARVKLARAGGDIRDAYNPKRRKAILRPEWDPKAAENTAKEPQEDRPRISREQMDAAREAVFAANANAPVEPAVEPSAQADHLRNVAAATLAEAPPTQGTSESETPPDEFAWIKE